MRQAACQVIQAIILTQSLPSMLERLNKAFDHKNHRVKEAVIEIIKSHLHQQGLADMTNSDVSRLLLPKLVAALSDSQASVRLASQETLTVLYSCIGEPFIQILEKHSIRPAQMRELASRFEKATAVPSMAGSEGSQCAVTSHLKPSNHLYLVSKRHVPTSLMRPVTAMPTMYIYTLFRARQACCIECTRVSSMVPL